MSEKRVIRINKVLRELNISLDRAVDFLKEKGHEIESSPNAKISQEEYDVLCNQFSADKGKKEASLEVSEEKKKEKEALKRELEKEQELKRLQEEKLRREQEVIKAKANIVAPKAVGKIDLNPEKTEENKKDEEKPVAEVVSEKTEVVEPSTPKADVPKEKPTKELSKEKEVKPQVVDTKVESDEPEKITTQYQKLSGDKDRENMV